MLKKLLEMQEKLDKKILRKELAAGERFDYKLSMKGYEETVDLNYKNNSHLLTQTILAMQVELSEFANETRCFKHWSKKGLDEMDREKALEEYIDVLHFFLSIANQLEFTEKDIIEMYGKKNKINYDRQNNGY